MVGRMEQTRNQRGWFPFNLTVAYDSPDSNPPSTKHVLDLISNFKPTENLPLEKIPNVAPSEFPTVSQELDSTSKTGLDQNSSVSSLASINSKCLDATNSASASRQHDFQIQNLQQSCMFPATSSNSSPFNPSTTSRPPAFHSLTTIIPQQAKIRPSHSSTSAEPTSSIDPTSLSPNSEQDKSHEKSPIFLLPLLPKPCSHLVLSLHLIPCQITWILKAPFLLHYPRGLIPSKIHMLINQLFVQKSSQSMTIQSSPLQHLLSLTTIPKSRMTHQTVSQ